MGAWNGLIVWEREGGLLPNLYWKMLSQNFRFITACTGEAVEPVNRLGSVLVFGAKSFDSPPFWSAEEPDCSVVSLSWIQRLFYPWEQIFEFYDGEFLMSAEECPAWPVREGQVYVIWISSVAFLFWKAGIHRSGKRMNQLESFLVRGKVLGRSIGQRWGRGGGEDAYLPNYLRLFTPVFALRSAFSLPPILVWDFTLWNVTWDCIWS